MAAEFLPSEAGCAVLAAALGPRTTLRPPFALRLPLCLAGLRTPPARVNGLGFKRVHFRQ